VRTKYNRRIARPYYPQGSRLRNAAVRMPAVRRATGAMISSAALVRPIGHRDCLNVREVRRTIARPASAAIPQAPILDHTSVLLRHAVRVIAKEPRDSVRHIGGIHEMRVSKGGTVNLCGRGRSHKTVVTYVSSAIYLERYIRWDVHRIDEILSMKED
jgi:hypothetical protein